MRTAHLDSWDSTTHPEQTVGFDWRHDEMFRWKSSGCEKGLVKVGELTDPMVNVISWSLAKSLDPSGNIDKELRPV